MNLRALTTTLPPVYCSLQTYAVAFVPTRNVPPIIAGVAPVTMVKVSLVTPEAMRSRADCDGAPQTIKSPPTEKVEW